MELEFDLENPFPPSDQNLPSMLFEIETDHMPLQSYTQTLLLDSADSHMISTRRREAISSILRLPRKDDDPFVPYLAINYMDRFVSSQRIQIRKLWMLKLAAVSCALLAFKMLRPDCAVPVPHLQEDGDYIFDSFTIKRMEVIILEALQWRMRSINPFSFLNYYISLFEFDGRPSIQALKHRATEIILKSQNEIKLLGFKPSVICASSLLCSAQELFPLQFTCFRNAISTCSYVNEEDLSNCYNVMQEAGIES
ncbi:putative cyclin-D6-1 [Primulina huaijiensis]|uniref:putative cyclin-D6-1 n=1 Tax=Primulina huaijiensis TaxID=1492673 RepID=UPI003CC6F0D1